MISRIIKAILDEYGIDQKMIDKVKSIVDNIDIVESNEEIRISINLKNVNVVVSKEKINEGE
jgi:hypothetical protein